MDNDLLDPSVRSGGFDNAQSILPNATAVLVLGIISIVGCFLYGIPGIICGIIAIALYRKDKRQYDTNPEAYALSFKNAKAGYICAIIGLSLSLLFFLIFFIYAFFIVALLGSIR